MFEKPHDLELHMKSLTFNLPTLNDNPFGHVVCLLHFPIVCANRNEAENLTVASWQIFYWCLSFHNFRAV